MKKSFSFILLAASLLLASGAQAQGLHIRADVPFDFTINNTVYAAGSYDIRGMSNTGAQILGFTSKVGQGIVLPSPCSKLQPAKETVLVFHRVGDEYFLYQIWVAGSSVGSELPQPKSENQLARNGQKSEEVIVAANLTK